MDTERRRDLIRFYSILDDLEDRIGGARKLADCSGAMEWPRTGVYFFREVGEDRTDTGNGPRIVRVGTHGLTAGAKSTLWSRLIQHRGQAGSGSGNHRSSIFRLTVGAALITREGLGIPTWGDDAPDQEERSRELSLELQVSAIIRNMPFLWLSVADGAGPYSRGFIERSSIALLSNSNKQPLDAPSQNWLGNYSNKERVRKSGLWNQNHVEEICAHDFLDHFERLVSETRRAA
jgi:hypothetical protein